MSKRKPPQKRKSMNAHRGRPTVGESFQDAVLRSKIRRLLESLGGRGEASAVYDLAVERELFTASHIARFARRAGVEYVRGALGDADHSKNFPYAHPVTVANGRQMWIRETLMDDGEYSEMLRAREKQLGADYGEYRRLWERGAARFGADLMPRLVQMEFAS